MIISKKNEEEKTEDNNDIIDIQELREMFRRSNHPPEEETIEKDVDHYNNINNGNNNDSNTVRDVEYDDDNNNTNNACSWGNKSARISASTRSVLHDNNTQIGRIRNIIGYIINITYVQIFISILILINAGILGAQTFKTLDEKQLQILHSMDVTILIIFTIELLAQIIHIGLYLFIQERWLIFDLCIVILSWSFISTSSISVFRSFRAFRVFALISRWDAPRTLFAAIGKTVPRMCTIWLVLLVFFYTFSVLFTSLFQDLYDDGYLDYDYFGRLDNTFITLFQFMTLDSWTGVVRQVMEAKQWAWIGFFVWVIITAFFMINLVIAVICESIRELDEMKQRKRQRQIMNQQRIMITNQKEELFTQTQLLKQLQKQVLDNQLEMQRTLNDVLSVVSPPPPITNVPCGKKRSLLIAIQRSGADEDITKEKELDNKEAEREGGLINNNYCESND